MKRYISAVLLVISVTVWSCSKDNMVIEEPIPYQKIGEGYAPGAATRVEIFVKESLSTGFNPIYVALYDSLTGNRVQNASITLKPMMDMGSMKHSSPVENPAGIIKNNFFEGAVIFTMPSGAMGTWTLDLNIAVNGRQGKLTIPVVISQPAVSRLKSFVSKADNAKFFVAFLQPSAPKVGVNDMEIAIYRSASMMSYPADSSLTVSLVPEMPTMGHGSPNNVDPVHTGRGHYKGKANFTMTGLWYLNLDFMAGAAVADTTTYFEVNF
jgi:hypothetical protein